MNNRRKFILGTGIAAALPLAASPTAAASDTHAAGHGDLRDEYEINQLLLRYTRGLDRRDEAVVAGVFVPNPLITYELIDREFTSATEFAHFLITGLNTGIAQIQHYLSSVTPTVSGNEADCLSYIFSPAIRKNGTFILVGGQYEDKLIRTRSGWRITRRKFDLYWTLSGTVEQPNASDMPLA